MGDSIPYATKLDPEPCPLAGHRDSIFPQDQESEFTLADHQDPQNPVSAEVPAIPTIDDNPVAAVPQETASAPTQHVKAPHYFQWERCK